MNIDETTTEIAWEIGVGGYDLFEVWYVLRARVSLGIKSMQVTENFDSSQVFSKNFK